MKPESVTLEYKRELTSGFEKEAVAFLNHSLGGVLYIGVDDDGTAVGIDEPDAIQLKIKDRLKHNIAPSCLGLFDVILAEIDSKPVIKVIFASGTEKPYYIAKHGMSPRGCYLRIGSASEPMLPAQIEQFFAKRTRNSLGKISSPRQDLRFEQLQIYYQALGHKLNENFPRSLELLTSEGLYNYAAYLLADENNISIKVAKYSGLDRADLIESNEYGYTSLIKATKQVLDKLELENRTNTLITSKERKESRPWHAVALRETVINAIIHNDYSHEVPPKFEIFADRLEITSAGGLLSNLSQEEFFAGHSVPRNKELMRIFKDLDLVEQLGSGLPRILLSYPRKHFVFSENFLRSTFPNHEGAIGGQVGGQVTEDEGDAGKLNLIKDTRPITRPIGGPIGGQVTEDEGDAGKLNLIKDTRPITHPIENLTERQRKIITLMTAEPKISKRELAERLCITASTAQDHIEALKKKGVLIRIGGTRGHWETTENNGEGIIDHG
ncbi:MAG: putative DNA binding domain-containing protein [Verrucomicrobiales bacterium]|nr:putative DNA binding domain-containing protein [Verrucomicrobiales bacterium]